MDPVRRIDPWVQTKEKLKPHRLLMLQIAAFLVWLLMSSPYLDLFAQATMNLLLLAALIRAIYRQFKVRGSRLQPVLSFVVIAAFDLISVHYTNRNADHVSHEVAQLTCRDIRSIQHGEHFLGRKWILRNGDQWMGPSSDFGPSITLYVVTYEGLYVVKGDHALGMGIYKKIPCPWMSHGKPSNAEPG